jgi:hypothetical protein
LIVIVEIVEEGVETSTGELDLDDEDMLEDMQMLRAGLGTYKGRHDDWEISSHAQGQETKRWIV